MSSYKRRVTYEFEANGDGWTVTSFGPDCVEIEETRKNGQEDCHVYATLVRGESGWKLDDDSREDVGEYYGPAWADALEAFLAATPWAGAG